MTSSLKIFVLLCTLLVADWGTSRAATDDDAASTGTPSSTSSGSEHKTHHRRHHTKTTASTNSSSANADSSAQDHTKTGSAKATSTDDSSPSQKHTKSDSADAKSKPDAGETDANASAASESSTAKTTTATTAGKSKRHSHHSHGSSTTETSSSTGTEGKSAEAKTGAASASSTAATPAAKSSGSASPAGAPASASGAAAAAAGLVNGPVAVAATGKGRHHRHGKNAKLPEPPLVVTPSATPLPAAVSTALPPSPATVPLTETPSAVSAVPQVQTGLPVARPGAGTTASLPIAMVRNPVAPLPHFTFPDNPARSSTRIYPWRSNIVTTVFWIGEGSTPLSGATNLVSAWDLNWVHHNGGADDQYDMSGYASGTHASTLNPFYVALPFNDLAYPDQTLRWLPDGWQKPTHRGEKPISACQGRWVEIKNGAGRVCFAQWEDVGPIVTNDPAYVFGGRRPEASRGLDVSPAVAKYLGIGSSALTSWRFVDDGDVAPGLWLRYDEQAILFQALKDQAHRGGNTPVQDLAQPIPDGSTDDANHKQINGARG